MGNVDRILAMIKGLTVQEVIDLTRKLESDIGKPPEHSRRGVRPKRPSPTLKGGATVIPEHETRELVEAISKRQSGGK